MKGLFALLVLVGGVVVALKFSASSVTEGFDPAEQGRQARAAVESCASWTEVLDRVGVPSRWRDGTSSFDFSYVDRFNETTRDQIARELEKNGFEYGFSYLYDYGDAVTFAVNFDRTGKFTNVQDKEGKGALMDAAGG